MPYVTSIERLGREEGLEQGLEQGRQQGLLEALRLAIHEVLTARFGALPSEVENKVQAMADEASLRQALRRASTTPSTEDFLQSL